MILKGSPLRIGTGSDGIFYLNSERKWQERYFVIDPKLKKIIYYEVFANNTVVFKGEYQLSPNSKCSRVGSSVRPGKSNVLVVSGQARGETSDLYIAVSSSHVADEWIKLINKAMKGEDFNALDEGEACCNACTIA